MSFHSAMALHYAYGDEIDTDGYLPIVGGAGVLFFDEDEPDDDGGNFILAANATDLAKQRSEIKVAMRASKKDESDEDSKNGDESATESDDESATESDDESMHEKVGTNESASVDVGALMVDTVSEPQHGIFDHIVADMAENKVYKLNWKKI